MELATFAVLALAQAATPQSLDGVVLNEFCAINSSTLDDADGDASDWIELFNPGTQTVNLAGWGLSDDVAQPFKWVFPARPLPARSFLIVFASDKNRLGPELHTNFKLSGDGEPLLLTRPDGRRAHAYLPAFPEQIDDVSYGLALRTTGGRVSQSQESEGYFAEPTPGAPNGPAGRPVAPVEVSVPRGFQEAPFSLTLSCATTGTTIWYTLDGTEPAPGTASAYVSPLPIATTTVVRAIALFPVGNSLTRSVTHTYLFAGQVVQQSQASALAAGFPGDWIELDGTNWTQGGIRPGAWYGLDTVVTGAYSTAQLEAALKSIPSVSLAMPRDDWFAFDPSSGTFGIYANSEQVGPAWERVGSMEFIDPTGGPEIQANCSLEIQGGSSTDETNRSQLSIQMEFRSRIGPAKLEFPVVAGGPVERHDTLLLDGGNQGSIHANVSVSTKRHAQGVRDQFMMDLQREMGGLAPHGRHVHLFLNGLYWGVYDLHERPDEDWAGAHLPGGSAEYDWVKEGGVLAGNANPITSPLPGVWAVIQDIELGGLDESDTYAGQPAYDALQELVDLDDYIDYLILNFWALNLDWPHRNWMATARARLSGDLADANPDVQFRFHSWDAELTLGTDGITVIGDGFYDRTGLLTDLQMSAMWLYTALLEHEEFHVRFGDRAQAHLQPGGALYVDPAYSAPGTPFDPAFPERNAPAALYWNTATPLQQALILEYARWGNYFHAPGSVTPADWVTERTRILQQFCTVRSNVLLAQLRNAALYPPQDPPTLSQYGGPVPYGFDVSITPPSGTTVHYTLDGSDPRLPGGAVAPGALTYSGPIDISQRTTLRARALGGNGWSALVEATFPIDHDLVISEIMADNDTVVTDEYGEFDDWIEIENRGSVTVDLAELFLSDDPGDPTRWQIPSGVTLPAGGRLVFWADGQVSQGPLHASFSLSSSGETVGIYHDVESGNYPLDLLAFGPQVQDLSLAHLPDSSALLFSIAQPSPGSASVPPPGARRVYDALDPALNPVELDLVPGPIAIGQTLTFTADLAPPSSAGTLVVGSGTVHAPLGSGIRLATANVATIPLTSDGVGHAETNLAIPGDPGLVGTTFYAQCLIGSALSSGVAFTIGP